MTSGCAFFTASTTLAKLTCVPPYSMLNSMTFRVVGEAEGVGEDEPADPDEPQAARARPRSATATGGQSRREAP